MNDFFLLNNESLQHTFIDQKIEVKQIKVSLIYKVENLLFSGEENGKHSKDQV